MTSSTMNIIKAVAQLRLECEKAGLAMPQIVVAIGKQSLSEFSAEAGEYVGFDHESLVGNSLKLAGAHFVGV